MKRISTLPDLVAARIAAGEVIERPESVLRELLDNAIDSNADEIVVEVDGGGVERISVIDNGSGISREDLSVIANRHATSKIHSGEDLYNVHTLGFRGEALHSIASVSRLTIASHDEESGNGSTIVIDNGRRQEIIPQGPSKGTRVTMEELFYEVPARRSFLKRAQTEAQACRNTFVSKALAFPGISFKLYMDGALRLSFEATNDIKERVMMLYRPLGIADADTLCLRGNGEDFSLTIVCAKSIARRSDRKEIRIYVNNRQVDDFALQQAVSYGYGEMLPGGSYPYCSVFLEIKNELADFNIHPAKREVKIRCMKEVHHAISVLLREGLERVVPEIKANQKELFESAGNAPYNTAPAPFPRPRDNSVTTVSWMHGHGESGAKTAGERRNGYTYERETIRPEDNRWLEKAKQLKALRDEEKASARTVAASQETDEQEEELPSFRYIGQAFRLFLIAEKDGTLYFVDQHAAHERIIYDELVSKKTLQTLLVPIEVELEKDVDEFLKDRTDIYTNLGIMIQRVGEGKWEINALPSLARPVEKEIVSFMSTSTGDEKELEQKLFAIVACKAAIKAGDDIDDFSAEAILEKVFAMKDPACPHGRTFLIKLDEKELRQMVGRTQ